MNTLPPYFQAYLLLLFCNSGHLSCVMLQGFLSVMGLVTHLIYPLQILTKLFAWNLKPWARPATYSMQGRMLSMIHYPGPEDGKTKACFTICPVHYSAFLGDILQWCKDQIKDSKQRISIDFPQGFVYTADLALSFAGTGSNTRSRTGILTGLFLLRERIFPIVTYTGQAFLSPEQMGR